MTYTQAEIESVTTERLVELILNQGYTIFHAQEVIGNLDAAYALYGQYIFEMERREDLGLSN